MNKSNFIVSRKVYNKLTDEVLYMYSFSQNDNFVVCTYNPDGYGNKVEVLYKNLSTKPSKHLIESEKKYNHSKNVVTVFNDVNAMFNLFKDESISKDEIAQLMTPYIGNTRYWDFVLHTVADNPKLHTEIKKLLTK